MPLDKTYFMPRVVQTVAGENFTVFAYLNDGSVRLVDIKPYIKGRLCELLLDEKFFCERLTVLNETIAWDVKGDRDVYSCIDIDPCDIYACDVVDDPLKEQ